MEEGYSKVVRKKAFSRYETAKNEVSQIVQLMTAERRRCNNLYPFYKRTKKVITVAAKMGQLTVYTAAPLQKNCALW